MRRSRILAAIAVALLAPLLLTACGEDDAAAGTGPAAVEGIPWVLASGAGHGAGTPAPTATFEGAGSRAPPAATATRAPTRSTAGG